MDEQPVIPGTSEPKPARSNLLTVLCILTFIGSGMNLFSSAFIAAFFDAFAEVATTFADKFNIPGIEMILEARPVFFAASALCYALSLAGALLMWRLRRLGFHLYTTAQILLVIAPMYFFKLPSPSLFDILLSGTFILLYSTNLKTMS
jgi:hypothetical protein